MAALNDWEDGFEGMGMWVVARLESLDPADALDCDLCMKFPVAWLVRRVDFKWSADGADVPHALGRCRRMVCDKCKKNLEPQVSVAIDRAR